MMQNRYDILLQINKEMLEHIRDLEQDQKQLEHESSYMKAFIHYRNLDDDYIYFREHAREVYDEDNPFPYITL